jgi:hypothetical protein
MIEGGAPMSAPQIPGDLSPTRFLADVGTTTRPSDTLEIGPIAVTLDANNVVACLVIDAKSTTNEEAGRVKATGGPNGTIRR